MDNLKKLLFELNLSPKETEIFLSLVRLGKATAAALARESGITRTHVYDLAQELMAKGLASEVEERGIKIYEAVDHAGLMAYISRQQQDLARVQKDMSSLSSEFNALQLGQRQKTKVRFFDGAEGVKNIYEEIRKDFQKQPEEFEFMTIFSPANLERIIPGFQYFSSPGARGRDIVCVDGLLPRYERQITASGHNVQYKIWPADKGFFPTDNICWLGKLAYIDLAGHPSGIVIENKSIVQTFTMWFNGLWGSLK